MFADGCVTLGNLSCIQGMYNIVWKIDSIYVTILVGIFSGWYNPVIL